MRKKVESQLKYDFIADLNTQFERKKWNEINHYDMFLDRFCGFMEKLNNNQQELILELTEEFEWITYNQYPDLLTKALVQLKSFDYLNLDKIYVLPLLSKGDRAKGKDKSSRLVSYLCQDVQFKYHPTFSNTKFQRIDMLEHLPRETKISNDKTPIILVDDFVGTGETAEEAIDELFSLKSYPKEYVFIVSLVSQKIGFEYIKSKDVNILTGTLKEKGISDKYKSPEKEAKKALMGEMEDLLNVDSENRLGYKESEALVTMIRTPNNTFPIYWLEANLKDGDIWNAPFPR